MKENETRWWKQQIDGMGQVEMARLQRYAPAGHPVFDRRNGLYEHFETRFKKVGGMTPAVSKAIG